MSHAKEIKQKKELQAKFSLAVNNTSSLISSWLKPSTITETVETDASKSDFLNLPIISGSSGLLLSSDYGGESSDINTIGDYVKTGKSLKTLNKKKNNANLNGKIQKNPTQGSRALHALRNKLKKQDKIKNTKNDAFSAVRNKPVVKQVNDNSDSEDEVIQKSAPKKSHGLLIDSKINKRKNKQISK